MLAQFRPKNPKRFVVFLILNVLATYVPSLFFWGMIAPPGKDAWIGWIAAPVFLPALATLDKTAGTSSLPTHSVLFNAILVAFVAGLAVLLVVLTARKHSSRFGAFITLAALFVYSLAHGWTLYFLYTTGK